MRLTQLFRPERSDVTVEHAVAGPRYPLDLPLLKFSPHPADTWTLRDACEGTQIFGATGSGKTSGSGQMLAKAFLRAGFGGLVLCAKPGERALWERYCEETGRSRSLMVFDGFGERRFNFLNYELHRSDRLVTHNLVALFLRLMEAVYGPGGKAGATGDDAHFFRGAVSELLSNSIMALYGAEGRVTLAEMMQMIDSAPESAADLASAKWRQESFCFQTILKLWKAPVHRLPDPDGKALCAYWFQRHLKLSDKTRTNVIATLTSLAHPFLTGPLRELFCTTTDTVPEFTHHGTVLVIDFPIKEWAEVGVLAQHIFKYLWQRAAERRTEGDHVRPVFLWVDECQFFVSEYDMEFQSTARSARACTVYMTQNLPTYYARMGGRHPEHTANALLGNFQTKIFHQNSDATTNRFGADLIGQIWQWTETHGTSDGGSRTVTRSSQWGSSSSSGSGGVTSGSSGGGGASDARANQWGTSYSRSQTVQYEILPSMFNLLKKGGRGDAPEAFVVQGGRLWKHSGRPWLHTAIPQG